MKAKKILKKLERAHRNAFFKKLFRNSKLFSDKPEQTARWKKQVEGWERQTIRIKYDRKFNNKYTHKEDYSLADWL